MNNQGNQQIAQHVPPQSGDIFSKYEKLGKIGEGIFGDEVIKAREIATNKLVAIKSLRNDGKKAAFLLSDLLRTKDILESLSHKNVVNLIEIRDGPKATSFYDPLLFHLVFDFCEYDLAGLVTNLDVNFSLGEIKNIMFQLLNGLLYIHKKQILHRDVEPANILITKNGTLKLTGFSSARRVMTEQAGHINLYTTPVVQLWYRAPELLLGERNYGPSVDLWSVGCVMAEMWKREPLMRSSTEQKQLTLISNLCGSITSETLPGVELLPIFNNIELPKNQPRQVKETLGPIVSNEYACDLLDELLVLDPSIRCDADSALNHNFFWTYPSVVKCDLAPLLARYNDNMFEYNTSPIGSKPIE